MSAILRKFGHPVSEIHVRAYRSLAPRWMRSNGAAFVRLSGKGKRETARRRGEIGLRNPRPRDPMSRREVREARLRAIEAERFALHVRWNRPWGVE